MKLDLDEMPVRVAFILVGSREELLYLLMREKRRGALTFSSAISHIRSKTAFRGQRRI
jgi:hypothetical protein